MPAIDRLRRLGRQLRQQGRAGERADRAGHGDPATTLQSTLPTASATRPDAIVVPISAKCTEAEAAAGRADGEQQRRRRDAVRHPEAAVDELRANPTMAKARSLEHPRCLPTMLIGNHMIAGPNVNRAGWGGG